MANWEWRLAVGGVKLRVADRDAERARAVLNAMDAGEYALDADSDEQRELHAPDRESWSSRLAWLALMLFAIPLPWRRRARDDRAQRRLCHHALTAIRHAVNLSPPAPPSDNAGFAPPPGPPTHTATTT